MNRSGCVGCVDFCKSLYLTLERKKVLQMTQFIQQNVKGKIES